MGYDPYIGQTKAWLEARLREAQDEKAAGKSGMSFGAGDVNISKMVHESPDTRIVAILKKLNTLDSTTYPNGCWLRPTMTTARFTSVYPGAVTNQTTQIL